MLVMITGASAGIGHATAFEFAKHGHDVILTGRRTGRLEELQKEISEAYDVKVDVLAFDVRDRKACTEAISSLGDRLDQIDVLVNNAGLAQGLDYIHEADLDDFEVMIDTNIKGLLYMTRLVSPAMVKKGKGHIINVCSTAGHEVYPRGHVYCSTKHAVDALTKGFRLDLHTHGIRVSQVSPAHVEQTEFARVRFHWDEDKAKIYDDFQPLKSPDVAEAIYFIASRPPHVNVQDVVLMGTQQANSTTIDRSGRNFG